MSQPRQRPWQMRHRAALICSPHTAYLDLARQQGMSLADLGCSPLEFPKGWPRLVSSGRRVMRPDGRVATGDMPYLAKLVVSLERVGTTTERTAPYVDLLGRALEDRLVTQEEAAVLQETAIEWGLSREEVLSAHHSYIESLVGAALADGTVSELERRDPRGSDEAPGRGSLDR